MSVNQEWFHKKTLRTASTNPLILIGYWETESEDTGFIHPKHLIDPQWEQKNRKKIVQYLKSGSVYTHYMGFSHCRFEDGTPNHEMGDSELTDDIYVWPEGLWIYVEKYSIKLPEFFINHIKRNKFRVRAHFDYETDEQFFRARALDPWINWCNEQIESPK